MSFGSPTATTTFTFPNFDLGLGRAKKGVDVSAREAYTLCTLGYAPMFYSASVGANVAATTLSGIFVLPGRCKIPKIAVFCSAINALTGHSFNIVFGTAAYTASATTVPGNDNSSVPPIAYDADGQPTGNSSPTYAAGGGGFCTNPAVPGNTMFAADVVFNATNFPGNPNGSVVIPAITTATGTGNWAQYFVPNNPDAVWPQGAVMTLRLVTPASTGSITNLCIGAYFEPQPMSPTYPSSQQAPAYVPVGGIDY
jgi:hypothetical protein